MKQKEKMDYSFPFYISFCPFILSLFVPPSVSTCRPPDLHIDYYTSLIAQIEMMLPIFVFASSHPSDCAAIAKGRNP